MSRPFPKIFGQSGDILLRCVPFGPPILIFVHVFYWEAVYRGIYALIGGPSVSFFNYIYIYAILSIFRHQSDKSSPHLIEANQPV